MIEVKNLGKTENYVYDISLDGTVVNALGLNIAKQTDGFNFEMPEKFRYTEDNPYISPGLSRCTKEGKSYINEDADLAEFNDTYLRDFHYTPKSRQKMGCDIDEFITASINVSRKNYIDFFAFKPENQQFKLVGNSIKSKKMSIFLEKFLNKALLFLVKGQGYEFIEYYYEYLAKIYNYQIPLRDIATKGKIKRSVEEYLSDIKTLTKAGRPKSRQAWYELAIKNGLHVDNGDTIYYINTGTSKSHSDVKKITHYYYTDNNGEKVEFTKLIDKGYKAYKKECGSNSRVLDKSEWIEKEYPKYYTEDEIVMNCMLVPQDIVDSETDIMCNDVNGIEYNVPKYVDMFNKRITPLLVCFDRSIRGNILVTNPDDRRYFTREECEMVSGQPNKLSDQDTYEQLMTMEDKEIRFWIQYDMVPPFIEECGMGKWEDIVKDYYERQEKEKQLGIDKVRSDYEKIIQLFNGDDFEAFMDEGELPDSLLKIIDIDGLSGNFVSKQFKDVVIGTPSDIIDAYEVFKINKENIIDENVNENIE